MKFFAIALSLLCVYAAPVRAEEKSPLVQLQEFSEPNAMLRYIEENKHSMEKHLVNHWYESNCCSGKDCKPYETSEYRVVPGGYMVQYGMFEVFISESQIRPRPPGALRDEFFHFCIGFDNNTDTPIPYCAYPPDNAV